ncbi:MAG: hypothetical protein WC878_03720 [Candidatus Paceibacterota bacterium]|jgi:hypothetical protein
MEIIDFEMIEKIERLKKEGHRVIEVDYRKGVIVDVAFARSLEAICDVHIVTDSDLFAGGEV